MLMLVLFIQSDTRQLVESVLADAFIQVSAFVAATLAVYYGIFQSLGRDKISNFLGAHPVYGVAAAALLGALPGCGGTIVVITQYTMGRSSFGAVVAVLTSTMGDAAFLLLAQKPLDGFLVVGVSLVLGILMGYAVNLVHSVDFMKQEEVDDDMEQQRLWMAMSTNKTVSQVSYRFWQIILLPALMLGILAALQIDANALLFLPDGSTEIVGAIAGFIAVTLWALSSTGDNYAKVTCEECPDGKVDWMLKIALDTQFVTSWVVAAFLLFELTVFWFGIDLASSVIDLGPWVVLLAVLLGFLPGCGPQILVTGLYLQNAIPFSAQLGNAISNDGDALFPAIAMAPKAAILATLYSAIPALTAGYGFYYLFEK